MATLTGNAINTSYQGLIKFDDNGAVDPTTLKQLTDGTGGSLPIQVSQIQTKFQSSVDFTGATVTGLPSAAAGLEVGTGTNSLVNAVGGASTASGLNSLALGNACNTDQEAGIAIGDRASATGYGSFAAGLFAQAAGFGGFALGQYAESSQAYGSAFGPSSRSTAESGIAFGQGTTSSHAGAIAMGRSVSTVQADTTHVRELYIVAPEGATGGNGITMLSPNGTAYKLTVSDAGALVIAAV
jgi:trimeric autotransporter adhesin